VYLLLPIWLDAPRRQRAVLMSWAIGLIAAVVLISRLPPSDGWRIVRDWAPGLYLLAGYWLPGRLFTAPNERLERWLLSVDQSCLGQRVVGGTLRLPWIVRNYLELSYLLCYPLVPITFWLLYFSAPDRAAASVAADAFWSTVQLGVFICYGLLPWLPTRPPRAFLTAATVARSASLARFNTAVLNRVSIHVNTFPSGHVAAALAAALVVGQVLPAGGLVLGVIAFSIAAAAALGRYHYAADVVLGAVAAVVAFAVT
jgi:hypothetical protein